MPFYYGEALCLLLPSGSCRQLPVSAVLEKSQNKSAAQPSPSAGSAVLNGSVPVKKVLEAPHSEPYSNAAVSPPVDPIMRADRRMQDENSRLARELLETLARSESLHVLVGDAPEASIRGDPVCSTVGLAETSRTGLPSTPIERVIYVRSEMKALHQEAARLNTICIRRDNHSRDVLDKNGDDTFVPFSLSTVGSGSCGYDSSQPTPAVLLSPSQVRVTLLSLLRSKNFCKHSVEYEGANLSGLPLLDVCLATGAISAALWIGDFTHLLPELDIVGDKARRADSRKWLSGTWKDNRLLGPTIPRSVLAAACAALASQYAWDRIPRDAAVEILSMRFFLVTICLYFLLRYMLPSTPLSPLRVSAILGRGPLFLMWLQQLTGELLVWLLAITMVPKLASFVEGTNFTFLGTYPIWQFLEVHVVLRRLTDTSPFLLFWVCSFPLLFGRWQRIEPFGSSNAVPELDRNIARAVLCRAGGVGSGASMGALIGLSGVHPRTGWLQLPLPLLSFGWPIVGCWILFCVGAGQFFRGTGERIKEMLDVVTHTPEFLAIHGTVTTGIDLPLDGITWMLVGMLIFIICPGLTLIARNCWYSFAATRTRIPLLRVRRSELLLALLGPLIPLRICCKAAGPFRWENVIIGYWVLGRFLLPTEDTMANFYAKFLLAILGRPQEPLKLRPSLWSIIRFSLVDVATPYDLALEHVFFPMGRCIQKEDDVRRVVSCGALPTLTSREGTAEIVTLPMLLLFASLCSVPSTTTVLVLLLATRSDDVKFRRDLVEMRLRNNAAGADSNHGALDKWADLRSAIIPIYLEAFFRYALLYARSFSSLATDARINKELVASDMDNATPWHPLISSGIVVAAIPLVLWILRKRFWPETIHAEAMLTLLPELQSNLYYSRDSHETVNRGKEAYEGAISPSLSILSGVLPVEISESPRTPREFQRILYPFVGRWKLVLRRSESLDNVQERMGMPYFARKALANWSTEVVYDVPKGPPQLRIFFKLVMGYSRTAVLYLDDRERQNPKEALVWGTYLSRHSISVRGGAHLRSVTRRLEDNFEIVETRRIQDDPLNPGDDIMVYAASTVNGGLRHTATRIFERLAADVTYNPSGFRLCSTEKDATNHLEGDQVASQAQQKNSFQAQ